MALPNQTGAAALRAVPMGLYPTMDSLESVIGLATTQMPTNKNEMVAMLMIYHNTMLKIMGKDHVNQVDQQHQAHPDHLQVQPG